MNHKFLVGKFITHYPVSWPIKSTSCNVCHVLGMFFQKEIWLTHAQHRRSRENWVHRTSYANSEPAIPEGNPDLDKSFGMLSAGTLCRSPCAVCCCCCCAFVSCFEAVSSAHPLTADASVSIASLLLAAALSIPHEHNPVHVERGHSAVTRNARHAMYSIWANTQAHPSSPLYLLRRIHYITKVFFHFQDFLGRTGTCFRDKLKQTQGLQDYLNFAKKPLPTILTSLWHCDVTKAKLIKTCTKTWTSTATTAVLLQWFHCIFL